MPNRPLTELAARLDEDPAQRHTSTQKNIAQEQTSHASFVAVQLARPRRDG